MKNTKKCPKCESTKLLKISGATGAYGSGNNIATGLSIFSSVKVTRLLCSACGFIEEWIEKKEDIEKIIKKYKDI